MLPISKVAVKIYLLCYILFTVVFTLTACSQSISTIFPSLASLRQAGETKCLQPPSSMDLQTSTDQQLISWGLPIHEVIANNPALVKNLANLKHRVCGSTSNAHSRQQPATLNNTIQGTWAGYIARGNRGTYTEANMYFTVPHLTGTPGVADSSVSEWVGMGDGLTSPVELVQAGVNSDVDPNDNQTNYAFWEVVGAGLSNVVQPMKLTVNTGDQIWVYASSNADSDGYDSFLVKDLTQGTYQTAYEYDPNAFSDSSSAECIVEHPSIGTGPRPLANFGTLSITGCGAYIDGQGGMAPIGNFANDQINTVDNNGVTLANTSSLTNGSDFNVTWQSSGS